MVTMGVTQRVRLRMHTHLQCHPPPKLCLEIHIGDSSLPVPDADQCRNSGLSLNYNSETFSHTVNSRHCDIKEQSARGSISSAFVRGTTSRAT